LTVLKPATQRPAVALGLMIQKGPFLKERVDRLLPYHLIRTATAYPTQICSQVGLAVAHEMPLGYTRRLECHSVLLRLPAFVLHQDRSHVLRRNWAHPCNDPGVVPVLEDGDGSLDALDPDSPSL